MELVLGHAKRDWFITMHVSDMTHMRVTALELKGIHPQFELIHAGFSVLFL